MCGCGRPRMPNHFGVAFGGATRPRRVRDFAGTQQAWPSARASVDIQLLGLLREDLNRRSQRAMAVLRPIKLVINNYPDGQVEEFEVQNNPEDAAAGTRKVPFSRRLFIEREGLPRVAAAQVLALYPGNWGAAALGLCHRLHRRRSRARPARSILEVHSGRPRPRPWRRNAPDSRKVRSTIHWNSGPHAVEGEVRI